MLYPGYSHQYTLCVCTRRTWNDRLDRKNWPIHKIVQFGDMCFTRFYWKYLFFLLPLMFLDPPYKTISGTQTDHHLLFLSTHNQLARILVRLGKHNHHSRLIIIPPKVFRHSFIVVWLCIQSHTFKNPCDEDTIFYFRRMNLLFHQKCLVVLFLLEIINPMLEN